METLVTFKDSSSLTITFTIPNFSSLKSRTDPIQSAKVNIRRSVWYIEVVGKYVEKGYGTSVEISVYHDFLSSAKKNTGQLPVATVDVSVLNSDFDPCHELLKYDDAGCESYLRHWDIWGPYATKPLKDDKLEIRADIKLLYQEPISDELSRYRLCKIFGSDVGRDFTLVTADGKERRVHKAVLNAASPVFERMFQSNLEECRTGRCVITDISVATLDMLLGFMYNCSVEDLPKNAKDIMAAADKYEMLDLKKACEEAVRDTLSLENATDVLLLADKTAAADLKQTVLEFVTEQAGKDDSADRVDAMMDKAVKSGRTDIVKELFNAVFKSGRKW